jgi:hypothetical protein
MADLRATERELFGDQPAKRAALAAEVFEGRTHEQVRALARRGAHGDTALWAFLFDPECLDSFEERHRAAVWSILSESAGSLGLTVHALVTDDDELDLNDDELRRAATKDAIELLALERTYGAVNALTEDSEGYPGRCGRRVDEWGSPVDGVESF